MILKVGSVQVTQEQFESQIGHLETQSDADQGGANKDRRRLGDDYASVLMLSQLAVTSHLDASPEVASQLALARLQVLSDAEFAHLMHQSDPTTEEISKYYADHLSDYDQVHIRRLFIWKQRGDAENGPVLSSQAAKAHADQIVHALASGADVKQLSDDLRKSEAGMLDPGPLAFSRGELSGQMEKIAFTLKEGEWSEVEDTPARLLMVQLVQRDRQPLSRQVSSRIEKDLQAQKMEALLDGMKKDAGIWMDKQYFGTVVAPVPGAQRRNSNPPSELQNSAEKGERNNDQQEK